MVELGEVGPDGVPVPTIGDLIQAYKDRTGASYRDMARKVRDEVHTSALQKLVRTPPREFATARTMELLAELLEVPVATIVLAYAASLGIPVRQGGTTLERTLPPGTEDLTPEDRDAVRAVVRQLVQARNQLAHSAGEVVDLARPPAPDLSRVAARRPRRGPDQGDR